MRATWHIATMGAMRLMLVVLMLAACGDNEQPRPDAPPLHLVGNPDAAVDVPPCCKLWPDTEAILACSGPFVACSIGDLVCPTPEGLVEIPFAGPPCDAGVDAP